MLPASNCTTANSPNSCLSVQLHRRRLQCNAVDTILLKTGYNRRRWWCQWLILIHLALADRGLHVRMSDSR